MQETFLHFTQSAVIFPTRARTIVPTPAGSMFPTLTKLVNAKLLLKVKFKCLICTWLSFFFLGQCLMFFHSIYTDVSKCMYDIIPFWS